MDVGVGSELDGFLELLDRNGVFFLVCFLYDWAVVFNLFFSLSSFG